MSKHKTVISFKNITQLWNFAQQIKAVNIEIITNEHILICECGEEEIMLVKKYGGQILQDDFSSDKSDRSRNDFARN